MPPATHVSARAAPLRYLRAPSICWSCSMPLRISGGIGITAAGIWRCAASDAADQAAPLTHRASAASGLRRIATRSTRWAPMRLARLRTRLAFSKPKAWSGSWDPVTVRTSTDTRTGPSRARMSISPPGSSTLRATTESPCRARKWAATSSPMVPTRARSTSVALLEFLDVDVVEGEDSDLLQESGGAEHVPHPGITERDLEVEGIAVGLSLHLHVVGEVEAPLGLHDEAEQREDIPILLVDRQFGFGLVALEIFFHQILPDSTSQLRSSNAWDVSRRYQTLVTIRPFQSPPKRSSGQIRRNASPMISSTGTGPK